MTARPDLGHPDDAAIEGLLGAYALDACEPEEVSAIEAVLARRPDLADEAARLSNAAAWIGATEALVAPTDLRASLVDAIRRRGAAATDAAARCYSAATARVGATIAALEPEDHDMPTPNGLTARELVIHLAAQDSAFAEAVGAPPVPDMPVDSIDTRTAAFVERFGLRPLDEVVELWQRSVDVVVAWANSPTSLGTEVDWLGYHLARSTLLVARAFETWIHRDDLRRVAGQPIDPPPGLEIAEMADFSARNTEVGLAMTGRDHAGKVARLVLTGAGGGAWIVAMGADADTTREPDVTVTADVVDWCLVAGERLEPASLERAVDGDESLAADLVAAAPAFSTL